jgi:hypothetical protein
VENDNQVKEHTTNTPKPKDHLKNLGNCLSIM